MEMDAAPKKRSTISIQMSPARPSSESDGLILEHPGSNLAAILEKGSDVV